MLKEFRMLVTPFIRRLRIDGLCNFVEGGYRCLGFVSLAMFLPLSVAVAAPHLSCEIVQGGDTRILEFAPVADPYPVKAVDINGRFRFKAVVVGTEEKVAYISLYAYDLSSGLAVLLHQARYLAPLVAPENAQPDALTGQHHLYSPKLGREMQYRCALLEVAS